MHCRLCLLGGRKGRFSPLTSALRHYHQNACRSRRLPATGRCQSVLSATSRIQLQLCDVRLRCASPPSSTDAHAAPNLDQIEKIDYMSDTVGLGGDRLGKVCHLPPLSNGSSRTSAASERVSKRTITCSHSLKRCEKTMPNGIGPTARNRVEKSRSSGNPFGIVRRSA